MPRAGRRASRIAATVLAAALLAGAAPAAAAASTPPAPGASSPSTAAGDGGLAAILNGLGQAVDDAVAPVGRALDAVGRTVGGLLDRDEPRATVPTPPTSPPASGRALPTGAPRGTRAPTSGGSSANAPAPTTGPAPSTRPALRPTTGPALRTAPPDLARPYESRPTPRQAGRTPTPAQRPAHARGSGPVATLTSIAADPLLLIVVIAAFAAAVGALVWTSGHRKPGRNEG